MLHQLNMLNASCMSYFVNYLQKKGICLNKYKPLHPTIADYQNHHFSPGTGYHYTRECVGLNCAFELKFPLEYSLNENAEIKLSNMADSFCEIISNHEHFDLVFPILSDQYPYKSAFNRDEDSGFGARLTHGLIVEKEQKGRGKSICIFDFNVLICEKYRQIKHDDWDFAEVWQPVSTMTDEERKYYI